MEPTPVTVTNWPAPAPGSYQLVALPTGQTVRVDYAVSFGDLFVGVALLLGVVTAIGSRLFDRMRGVL